MPSKQELKSFLKNELSDQQTAAVESWLNESSDRWQILDQVTSDGKLIEQLKKRHPKVIYQHDEDLQRAMAAAETASQGLTQTTHLPAKQNLESSAIKLTGYRIIRELGSGGMGSVYEAEHELLHQRVAVKIMSGRFSGDANAADRFLAEMKAIGKLNHPNLVRGLDARRENGQLFLVLEYLNGEDLDRLIKRTGPLPTQKACDFIRQAALGLGHSHQQGVIHRDIKPSNLMLTSDETIKVLDLGLARLETAIDQNLTGDQVIIGTPDYISPEQIQSPRQIDARADIYSLGCTLYFLLVGRPPYANESGAMPKLMAHINQSFNIPDSLRNQLPTEIVQIVSRMVHKDREQRFPTTEAVVEALEPYCQPLSGENRSANHGPESELLKSQAYSVPNLQTVSAGQRTKFGKQQIVWLAAAAALLAFLAFGIVLILDTDDGRITLRFENSELLAFIDVNQDDKVTIKDPSDGKTITVSIDREEAKLRLEKDGFEALSKDIQLDIQGQKVDVSFTPLPVKQAPVGPQYLPPKVGNPKAIPQVEKVNAAGPMRIALSYGRGDWTIKGNEVIQNRLGQQARWLIIGDADWHEYDLTFEGNVPDSEDFHGFGGTYHWKDQSDQINFGVGVYSNDWHEVSKNEEGKWARDRGMLKRGAIKPDTWHKIRIEVRRTTARCFLDDRLLFTSKDPNFDSGKCGVNCHDNRVRFRNIKVVGTDGKVLWDGLPQSIKELK